MLRDLLKAVPFRQVGVEAGTPTAPARADLSVEGEGDALIGAPSDGVIGPTRWKVGLGYEDDGELQALGPVYGEQAHRVRGVEDGLALAGLQLVPPPADVADELVQRVAAQRPREADELPYVGEGLVTPL